MRRLAATLSAFFIAVSASAASAATLTVTGFGDPAGATCTGTTCSSLRAAVFYANQSANAGSTIVLGAGTYTLGDNPPPTGPLELVQNMTISGAGESTTTIRMVGSAGDSVLQIPATTAVVAISDLTITGGHPVGTSPAAATGSSAGAAGGPATAGIQTDGFLTLDRVDVTGNRAIGGNGAATSTTAAPGVGGAAVGGIEVVGSLTLNESTVSGNTAVGGAGGSASGNANGATGGAGLGGILVDPGAGPVTVTNSDVSNNVGTGGVGGTSAGTSTNHGGAGGNAYGGLGAFPDSSSTASPFSITGTTVTGNYANAGSGGAGSGVAGGGTGGSAEGGGIFGTNGSLTVTDSLVDRNVATGGRGGSAPSASGPGGIAIGGGLAALSETLTVNRTTIGADSVVAGAAGATNPTTGQTPAAGANAFGGGAYLSGKTTVVNATVAKNVAEASAGAAAAGSIAAGTPGIGEGGGMLIQTGGTVVLASDTLAANAAEALGGGTIRGGNLDDVSAPVQVSDTIFSGGTASASASNCFISGTSFTDTGHNLESSTPSQCELTMSSDLVGANALLGPFAEAGGPGPTMAPTAASPARGAGGACTDPSQSGSPLLTTDERGQPRHAQCDIGAYETQPPKVTSTPTLSGTATVGTTLTCPASGFAGDSPLTFSVTWLRAGVAIAGATSDSYTPSSADVGTALSCSVTVTNSYGSVTATSNAVTVSSPTAAATDSAISQPPISPTTTTRAPTTTATSAPTTFAGASLRSATVAFDAKGKITISLSCPRSTPGGKCLITAALYDTTGTPSTSVSVHRKIRAAAGLLARGALAIGAGHIGTLKLTLTRAGRRAVTHLPTRVRVLVISRGLRGSSVRRILRATVRGAKRHR